MQPFSVVQTNLQEIDATLDVAAAIEFIEGYGADTWLLNCGGIVSFYPTELSFQTRSPYLHLRESGDLVGEAVAAAHARGIRVITRLDLSKVAGPIADAHPEWLYTSPEGEPQVYNGLYSVCPSGGYYQEKSFEVLDEIMSRYPIDGFFFNWFNFNERDYSNVYRGVCHCDSCKEGFAASVGGDLPAGPQAPNYWPWLGFSNAVTADLTQRIRTHIAQRNPDVALVLRKNSSVRYHEAAHAIGEETWHHETSESVSALVNSDPDVPVLVNSVSFVDMPYRMGAEQPARYAQYLAQTISRGGRPSTYFMGAPGRIPYANLGKGGEVNRFYAQHKDVYGGLQAAAQVAIVRPNRFAMRPPAYVAAVAEFRGVYSAFQQRHIPFEVIAVESLADVGRSGQLDHLSLVVVPDPGLLGAQGAAVLYEFIRHGGHVVITGAGGVDTDGAIELATSPAVRRIGEPLTGERLWSSYATLDEQDVAADFAYRSSVVPIFGAASTYEWRPEATMLGNILPQAPYGPPEKCYGHVVSDEPAAVRMHHGAGSVTVIPWTIGTSFREFGTDEVRDFLMRLLDGVVPAVLTADLPEQVEVVLSRSGADCVVHLLNMSGVRPRAFSRPLTVSGGRLRWPVSTGPVTATALVAGVELAPRQVEGEWVLDLPPLDLFEVLQIKGSSPLVAIIERGSSG
jgi:hypothetical protein